MSAPRPPTASRPARARLSWPDVAFLCLLLILPGYVLGRFLWRADGMIMLLVPLAMSVFAFVAYWRDKRAAEAGQWRVEESVLHLLALLGGWPGAFLAQRMFRHKTAKRSFQAVFWSAVLLYQYLATDSLLAWRCTGAAFRFIHAQFAH